MEPQKVIVDTDIMIGLMKRDPRKVELTSDLQPSQMILTAVTVLELMQGALNRRDLNKIIKAAESYDYLGLSYQIGTLAEGLIKKYTLSHDLRLPDALIAATAIASRMALLTDNVKDYQFIPNLRLYRE
ncbi:MAG: PIN domain-containing protein [Catalinimonas sp.]